MSDIRRRDYCLTIHDMTYQYEHDDKKVKYFIYGNEICPSTKKQHKQAYIYYINARSFKAVQKDFKGAHIEATKGTPIQAAEYCKKENEYTEYGELPQQGNRSDLDTVKDVLKETGRMRDVVNVATSYQSVRMAECILKYHEQSRKEKPYVRWFWGPTGTGKSKLAYEILGDECYTCLSTGKWFEGYDGHEFVLIDDMRKDFLKFHELLRLLDRYAMRVECKGGSRQFRATQIIITSCHAPHTLFDTREDVQQLIRRIDEIKEFTDPNDNKLDYESA